MAGYSIQLILVSLFIVQYFNAVLCDDSGYVIPPPKNKPRIVDGLKCHVCLGRDLKNCKGDETTCNGACYKLVDTDKQQILKGCHSEQAYDGEERNAFKVITTTEEWSGMAYFCQNDKCNSVAELVPKLVPVIISLLIGQCLINN